MKILHFITNTELGGAQRICSDLCNAAVQNNNEVIVVSMKGGPFWESLSADITSIQLPYLRKEINPLFDLITLVSFNRVLRKFNPDVVHLHSSKAGIIGRTAGLGLKIKIVYTVHGFDSIRIKHRIFLPFERFFQNFCSAIIPVSEYDKINLIHERITKNLIVIKNGCKLPINKELAIFCDNRKVIMSIARIAYPKRLDLFLEAAASQTMREYYFIWIGASDNIDLSNITVPNNVLLAGGLPDASSYIHYCSVFMLLSDFEGLPVTIIEAMAAGKPIIASNVGGISELVDSTNGVLVNNTASDIINSVSNLLSNDQTLLSLGKKSQEKYNKYYTNSIMWNSYNKVYQNLIRDEN